MRENTRKALIEPVRRGLRAADLPARGAAIGRGAGRASGWVARRQLVIRLLLNWRGLAVRALQALLAAQVATIASLVFVDRARRRRTPESGFPRARFDEVRVEDNELQLYCYGVHLFADMLAAIDGARQSIFLETYIWKDDKLGQEFKSRLVAKAKAGVEVYIIYDNFANLVVPRLFKQFPPGIKVLKYGGFTRPWHLLDPRRYARDHRKLLIVDGETAFIGGYNIGELYRVQWRDSHVRVRGIEAARLGQSFIDFWNSHVSPSDRVTRYQRRGLQPTLTHRTNDARRLLFPIRDMYVNIIDRAERQVWITNAYFIPDGVLRSALVSASSRGVDVRVLLPWTSNHIVADWLGRGFYRDLLAHGVRIFGYQKAMNHSKTMTVDGVWSTVGTANLDRLSQVGNYEINLEVFDAGFAGQMERLFEIDLTNAFEISMTWWHERPWYAKIGERVLAPLRPLF